MNQHEKNLKTLRSLQLAYDSAEPPDDDGEECQHNWMLKGRARDGTAFYKCHKCGMEEEG